ncbi:hypothetical protein ACQR16_27570 [Bradyrhizobium oligotrophicum]|uniref:hypothetical protein n=1 Tax=Bradyrhizobium oligotrophicum TaxID=44255 RepID=UPI003EC10A5E
MASATSPTPARSRTPFRARAARAIPRCAQHELGLRPRRSDVGTIRSAWAWHQTAHPRIV